MPVPRARPSKTFRPRKKGSAGASAEDPPGKLGWNKTIEVGIETTPITIAMMANLQGKLSFVTGPLPPGRNRGRRRNGRQVASWAPRGRGQKDPCEKESQDAAEDHHAGVEYILDRDRHPDEPGGLQAEGDRMQVVVRPPVDEVIADPEIGGEGESRRDRKPLHHREAEREEGNTSAHCQALDRDQAVAQSLGARGRPRWHQRRPDHERQRKADTSHDQRDEGHPDSNVHPWMSDSHALLLLLVQSCRSSRRICWMCSSTCSP